MAVTPRPEVLRMTEAPHGGAGEGRLDFSATTSPLGPSPLVRQALAETAIDCYPDREARAFVACLAERHQTAPTRILAGNGSSELIYLLACAYLRPGDGCLVIGPTYSEYARAASLMGARLLTCEARAEDGFSFPAEAARECLVSESIRVCFLCHPNNPTGMLAPPDELRQWLATCPETLFVVDEAYIELTGEEHSLATIDAPNLVVLRSLTKAYGLAGLRLGYALAAPDVIDVLKRVRIPWSVSSAAQAAGIAALADDDHLARTRATMAAGKAELANELSALGLVPYSSSAPYLLVRIAGATRVVAEMKEVGVLVRDCASMGLADHVRISPRTPAENGVLVRALRGIVS